jgi:hypothetical protein
MGPMVKVWTLRWETTLQLKNVLESSSDLDYLLMDPMLQAFAPLMNLLNISEEFESLLGNFTPGP